MTNYSFFLSFFIFFCSLGSFVVLSASLFDPLLQTGINWEGCTLVGNDYPITWVYNPANDTITFGVSSATIGYLGIGFNTQRQMYHGDGMIARFSNGQPTVDDYWFSDTAPCQASAQDGVCLDSTYTSPPGTNDKPHLIASGRTSSSTYFVYNRVRVGSDVGVAPYYDLEVPIQDEIQMLWAIGPTDEVGPHTLQGISSFYLTNQPHSCSSNCSGHGRCIGSCCICDLGFFGGDCASSDPNILDFGSAIVDGDEYKYGGKLDGKLHLYWNIVNDTDGHLYLDIGLSYHGSSTGWIGLGFSQSSGGHMSNSDTIVCQVFSPVSHGVSDDTFLGRTMKDTHADTDITNSDGTPGQNNILASNATSDDDHVYCKWRRYLNTGDEIDSIVENKHMKCIFAHSSDPNWGQHDWKDKGRAKINFYTGDIDLEVNLWVIHGGLMFVAWGALLPIGSILARYFKFIGDTWFQTHRILQTVAIVAQVAGFAVVVASVNREDESHFRNTHGRLGLTVFLLGLIQPFIGQLADFMFDPNRDMVPIFPDKIHWVFGWTAVVLGIVNVGLGLDFYESPDVLVILYIVWVIVVAVIGGIIHIRTKKYQSGHELNSPINYDLLR